MRYIERYHRNACKLLLTLSPDGDMNDQEFAESCDRFGEHITAVLRKSDLVMRCRKNQFFVFFTDIREDALQSVLDSLPESQTGEPNLSFTADLTDAEQLAALKAYTKLTPAQQALVSTNVKIAIGVASEDETAIADVVDKVNALTEDSTATDIAEALKAYAQLSDNQEEAALAQFTDEAKAVLGL